MGFDHNLRLWHKRRVIRSAWNRLNAMKARFMCTFLFDLRTKANWTRLFVDFGITAQMPRQRLILLHFTCDLWLDGSAHQRTDASLLFAQNSTTSCWYSGGDFELHANVRKCDAEMMCGRVAPLWIVNVFIWIWRLLFFGRNLRTFLCCYTLDEYAKASARCQCIGYNWPTNGCVFCVLFILFRCLFYRTNRPLSVCCLIIVKNWQENKRETKLDDINTPTESCSVWFIEWDATSRISIGFELTTPT